MIFERIHHGLFIMQLFIKTGTKSRSLQKAAESRLMEPKLSCQKPLDAP